MSSDSLSAPEMSAATKELLGRARHMVPPMLNNFHKGQLGRVGVLGGSEDYTGAPYFSAMASARLGCDMSHVICTPGAASVIKTYSPNLMVHPLMRNLVPSTCDQDTSPCHTHSAGKIADNVAGVLARLHVLVIGPGLGRDPLMLETVAKVVAKAREMSIPLVLDADALQLVQREPDLVKGYALAVLTPNVVEFGHLSDALGLDNTGEDGDKKDMKESSPTARVEALAKALCGVTVVQKGAEDYISNGTTTFAVDLVGGRKRSGGQGDTLTGSIATFLGWRKAYLDKLWDTQGDLKEEELVGLAAVGGSAITRECSRLAFAKRGRSLQASDLTDEVHTAFLHLFGEVDDVDSKL